MTTDDRARHTWESSRSAALAPDPAPLAGYRRAYEGDPGAIPCPGCWALGEYDVGWGDYARPVTCSTCWGSCWVVVDEGEVPRE